MTFPHTTTTARRRLFLALGLSLALAIAYGVHQHGAFAQTSSYEPGLEGQIWQQLPVVGRGLDMGNERPITTTPGTTAPTFSTSYLPTIADLWPCTADPTFGFAVLCYSSGIIGTGPGVSPDDAQIYGGRFAPCVRDQCYPSGRIGEGPATTWAFGPCVMRPGEYGTDCYPSGTPGSGIRVPPANGQLAGALGIAVDNTPNVGTIYITDHWNHRVQAFQFDGTPVALKNPIGNGFAGSGPYSQTVGGQTFTGELLNFPESIKVDASRQLIVADSGNGRVAIFDTDGNLVESFPIADPNSAAFIQGLAAPTGVALTPGATFRGTANPPGSRLVVTDKYNCAIYIFDATSLAQLAVIGAIKCADSGPTPSFSDIGDEEGVTLDNAGHMYVADWDKNRIEIFDVASATLIGAFGDPSRGAVWPVALSGPTDVMVDHRGVYTETDAQLVPHKVARVWVVDGLNQRLVAYKVNFDQPTPVATFLFELNAAGDLNGFPANIAEDISHDPFGKIVTTDTGNARIQRFQVPDIAVVNVVPNAATRTVSFDVLVPAGKAAGVSTVTPIVCPTSVDTVVSSGVAAPLPTCLAARALAPTAVITPGQIVTYSFQFASSQNSATFDIFATGNPVNGIPQTTSNHASATATNTCATCAMTPRVRLPSGTFEAFTAPVAPSTLYVGARVYTTQVSARVTATSSVGLTQILYQFISGPETANNAQPGLHTVTVSGGSAFADVPFRLQGTSVVEFWAKNTDGTEIAHQQAQLTLDLIPPSIDFRFDRATSSNATTPNAAGWWNKAVSLPLDFTGQITAVAPLGAGMPANPPLSSPLAFTTEGRNLAFTVTVTDRFGLSTTKSSNDPLSSTDPGAAGRGVNIDMTPPVFVRRPALTLERTSYSGAAPPDRTAAAVLALATDPLLRNGSAGSGVEGVAPAALIASFPIGTSAQAFVATDVAGNTVNGSVTVTVSDTIKPALTCPATVPMNAGALGTVFSRPGFSVSDASMINAPAGVTPVAVSQSVPATQILGLNATTTVTLTATDPSGNSSTCVTNVTTKPLTPAPPVITQSDVTASTAGTGAVVVFAPTVVDPIDGTNRDLVTCTPASGSTFPVGTTSVTCTTTDSAGFTAAVTFTVTVRRNTLVCSTATVSPGSLWPPNHQLVAISIGGVAPTGGGAITTRVTSIFQDEPTQGLGDGDTAIDGFIESGSARVRAERSGDGNGRVYYLNFTATAPSGSFCTGTVTVGVPHDQAHPAVGDGPKYDSTIVSSAQGDACHGESGHGHHDGDGCLKGHHGHFDGDACHGKDGFHHDGDGDGGGKDGGSHKGGAKVRGRDRN